MLVKESLVQAEEHSSGPFISILTIKGPLIRLSSLFDNLNMTRQPPI